MNARTLIETAAPAPTDAALESGSAGLTRRQFIGSSVAAGSLVVGCALPGAATAQGAANEVGAWVVVQPDEKVIIRIAR